MSDEVVNFRTREYSYPPWIRMSNSEPFEIAKHKKGGRPTGSKDKKSRGRTTAVLQYTKDGTFIAEHNSMILAADSVGVIGIQGISDCCRGRLKTSAGYKWRYKC